MNAEGTSSSSVIVSNADTTFSEGRNARAQKYWIFNWNSLSLLYRGDFKIFNIIFQKVIYLLLK